MRLGIRVKLLIFAAFVWAVIFGAYSLYIYKERTEQTRRMALATANFLSREIAASRQFYTSTVIKRAMDAGLKVSPSYQNIERSIPLHATFLRDVAKSLGTEGFHMELISLKPINPASAPKDAFQKEGLERFMKGTDTRFFRFEAFNGKQSVRYMIPDMATSETCLKCHNAYAASPKRDYRIGDVMGGIEITMPIESEMAAAMDDIWRSIGYGFVVILALGLVGLAFIRKVVTWPILNLVDTTSQLSGGDLTVRALVDSDDEVGDLGREVNEVIQNLHRMIEDIRRTSDEAVDISGRVRGLSHGILEGSGKQGSSLESIGRSMGEINVSMGGIASFTEELASSLEKGSSSVVELAAGITEVVDNMESLFTSVDETAKSTKDMSFSIREISENIENLSSAVTQVSSSMAHINARIREVETNAAEAARFAEEVIRDAKAGMDSVEASIQGVLKTKEITKESASIVDSLSERIREIRKILDVIHEVAEETNLLALNAAIIAAQSGEHGRSFSVVSNEIKDLAERTSSSAKEVSAIVGAVEGESGKAVKAMGRGVASVEESVRLSVESGEGLRKIVASAERSTTSVREIARAAAEQARESKAVADATEKVAEMSRRIVNATQEQARGAELINKASERMAEIAYKVKASAHSQVEANKQITRTIDDVNRMVANINSVVREQTRNTVKVLDAIEAVRRISVENIGMAAEADRSAERMASLDRELIESVRRFKLRRHGD